MIKKFLGVVVLVLLWSNITITYSAAEVLDYDCSNAPHGSVNPGTCWGDSAYQCDSGRPRQDFYDKIQSLSSAGTSGENGTPYSDGGKEAYDLYKKLCKIKKPVYDCSNAPHGSVNPGTCWGDSAYQCDSGRPRQDFYDKIQSLSSAGTSGENGTPYSDGGKEAYDLYKKLCKIKQKEKPKKNQDEILLKEQPKWLLDLFPFSMTQ